MNPPYWRNNYGYGPSISREFASCLRVMNESRRRFDSMTTEKRIEMGKKIIAGLIKGGLVKPKKRI